MTVDEKPVALNPCPFCGSDRVTVWNIRDGQQAVCKDCKSTGAPAFNGPLEKPDANQRAISAWNIRTSPEPVQDRQLVEGEREGCVGSMNAERAIYFLDRFKRDEKMLGPHEQWALDFSIAALSAAEPAIRGDVLERVARAIWAIQREDLDKCDMELEDVGDHYDTEQMARAALAAIRSGVE